MLLSWNKYKQIYRTKHGCVDRQQECADGRHIILLESHIIVRIFAVGNVLSLKIFVSSDR